MKYTNRANLIPSIHTAIPSLPMVLVPIITNYQGYFLTLSEMTECYHSLGMAHRNHRINKNIIFDPPETFWQFRHRLVEIMKVSDRYMCVLFEFGSFEPCWVTIHYERKEQFGMDMRYFSIFCWSKIESYVRECFHFLRLFDNKIYWSVSLQFTWDEIGIQSLGIAIYLAYRDQELRWWDEYGDGPLRNIVNHYEKRRFDVHATLWEFCTTDHPPLSESKLLITSFRGEICPLSSFSCLIGNKCYFPLYPSQEVRIISG